MKLTRLSSAVIVTSAAIIGLSACGSDDDDDTSTPVTTLPDALVFDEATEGEITNDPNNPLPFQFADGVNAISASVAFPDVDYITINVPAGSELTSIELEDYVSTNNQSFIAIQSGSVFTELVDDPQVANLLGYAHHGTNMIGVDILPDIGSGVGAQGFTPPLSAGDYTFWIQETGSAVAEFTLNFIVAPVP